MGKSDSEARKGAGVGSKRRKTDGPASEPPEELKATVDQASEVEDDEETEDDENEDDEEPEIGEERFLVCPFCTSVVLTDWEYSFQSPAESFCEHLVALHSWSCGAYEEPWIDKERKTLLDDLLLRDVGVEKKTEWRLHEWFARTMFSDETAIRFDVAGWEVRTASVYVEAGLGPKGGGPTYIGVFLRAAEKGQRTKASMKKRRAAEARTSKSRTSHSSGLKSTRRASASPRRSTGPKAIR